MFSRRNFLKSSLTSMAGVFLLNNKSIFSKNLPDLRENLQPFIDSLPIPLKTEVSRENRYILTMTEGFHRFHRAFLKSRVWGFNGGYLGPTIEVEPYKSISVLWQNKLPKKHLFTIDHRIHGAGYEVPDVRTVVHVHGAKTYDVYDGYPEDWFLPDDEVLYKYPNEQEAATLWYHDHALGITRLNVYAGLLGFYLIKDYIRDEKFGFPIGKKDIPLLIQDKIFNKFGQIIYPESFEPEVYGDYNVVNGKIWPYFEVEPELYRFRLLNASNARFYNLFLEGLPIYQIATERGLLKNFEKLKNLLLAPSERAEVVIDFSKMSGQNIKLNNNAPAPYPVGNRPDPEFSQVMEFRVKNSSNMKYFTLSHVVADDFDEMLNANVKISRDFTLDMKTDEKTNLQIHLLDKKMWDDPDIVQVNLDDVEIWRFINLTEDSHPMHLHLVKFIIIERQPFDVEHYNETNELVFTGPSKTPETYEQGFKDTIVANPAEVTSIKVKFEGYKGKYVWHCHMLEHEDFEMMLPYEVI